MKSIYENLDYVDYLSTIVTAIICLMLLLVVLRPINYRSVRLLSYLSFLASYFILLLDIGFDILPNSPDSQHFVDTLYIPVAEIEHRSFFAYALLHRIVRLPFVVFDPVSMVLVQRVIVIIAIAFFAQNIRNLLANSLRLRVSDSFVFSLACALNIYPSLAAYTLLPLREFAIFAVVPVFVLSVDRYFKKLYVQSLVYLCVTCLVLYIVRFHYVIILLLAVAFLLFQKGSKQRNSPPIFFVIGLTVIVALLMTYLKATGFDRFFTLAGYEDLRRWYVHAWSEQGVVYGQISGTGIFTYLIFAFQMCIQFLLAPIPILADRSVWGITATLDLFYLSILYSYLFFSVVTRSIFDKINVTIISLFLVLLVPSAMFEFFLTSVPRHRILLGVVLTLVICRLVDQKSTSVVKVGKSTARQQTTRPKIRYQIPDSIPQKLVPSVVLNNTNSQNAIEVVANEIIDLGELVSAGSENFMVGSLDEIIDLGEPDSSDSANLVVASSGAMIEL